MFRSCSVIVIAGCIMGCSQCDPGLVGVPTSNYHAGSNTPVAVKSWEATRLNTKYLSNAVRIYPKVISGGQPEGDDAFQELLDLGVKTIISVDGARPDVTTARKFGLRYIHLPHGYDGIPDERVRELAKAVRDLDGKIYIHCHHGKHRSPTAASVACVTAGLIPPSDALCVLHLAGTSPHYRGLYQSADRARPLADALLDELKVEFRESVDVLPLAEAMVALEQTHDHITQMMENGWVSPNACPDLEPAHEALLLQEQFAELLRTEAVQQQPKRFRELLQDSEAAAGELQSALRSWRRGAGSEHPPALPTTLAERISANCRACHEAFRDTPLSEKRGYSGVFGDTAPCARYSGTQHLEWLCPPKLVFPDNRSPVTSRSAVSPSCPRPRAALALVAEFAESQLPGKSIPEGLRAVEQHLAVCGECLE